ncbi:hypothetical protein [Myroides marinus]|uniref:hypothetical protein n=1 Tax=Myroides marinus TaxID=703342 RepID=UPI0025770155|nr:hypothetical protein [Myroides marinus]MDM1381049.1 hypothetical protein [Myroides marinus]MDM1388322.1 hypothetical protein [Myroides marinus]MDM1395534.1 hypothetical protein [Myroides marinus]
MKVGDYVEGTDLTFLSKDLPKALKNVTMSDAARKFKVSRTLIGMAVLEKESMLTINLVL